MGVFVCVRIGGFKMYCLSMSMFMCLWQFENAGHSILVGGERVVTLHIIIVL